MMVSISGDRGVGKTLYLAERVYQRSKQGYFVITNFSHAYSNLDCSGLSPEEFLDVILNVIDFKDNGYEMFNIHPSFRHTGVYVAMDEATIYFSPEMQAKLSKSNPDKYGRLLNLLAQARKYDVEIDYVVQDPAKVGKDFRRYTEHYIYFRWILKLKRLANVPHPRLPIYRREHRHLLDFIWMEVHDLDAENPKRNYSVVTDENGIAHFSEHSTLLSRKIRTTGMFKRKYLRMYNSYQPVAVRQNEYSKEFSPLKEFRLVPIPKKEYLPTIKRMLRKMGFKKITIHDEFLPPKIGFGDIVVPPRDEKNKIISEVQNQKHLIFSVDELRNDITRAYSKGASLKKKIDYGKFSKGPHMDGIVTPQNSLSALAGSLGGFKKPEPIRKFTKKNDPKKMASKEAAQAVIEITPEENEL
jgi:hypothetical protein